MQSGRKAEPGLDDGFAALMRLKFFAGVDVPAMTSLLASSRWQDVAAGAAVMEFGEASNDVFLIADGAVRVAVRTLVGQEIILDDLGPGDLFGEIAAIDKAPRSASITALYATRLCRLNGTAFMDAVLASPLLSQRLMRILTARLRAQDQRFMEIAILPVRHRLAADLLRLSRPRPNSLERVISPPPMHEVLAARIGTRRESISLALSRLARENLAAVSSRAIVLPRPDLLREMIDQRLGARMLAEPQATIQQSSRCA